MSGSTLSGSRENLSTISRKTTHTSNDDHAIGTRRQTPNDGAGSRREQTHLDTMELPYWLRQEKSLWRRHVQNFTPSWFAVVMGTGIVAILLHQIPFATHWLRVISTVIFILNTVLFFVFLFMSILRYTLYPKLWGLMLRHPTQSLFTGTFPMGFATLINMWVFECAHWGHGSLTFIWAMWWIDAVVALATCLVLPFLMMHVHRASDLSRVTAAWLLPVVAPIVASATAGIVAEALINTNPQHALWTVLAGYVLLGTGLPLAYCLLTIYLHRLFTHKLPAREVIVSVFLPLGPLGQGGFAAMQLGKVARTVFPRTGDLSPQAGEVLYVLGFAFAMILWGFGLVWLFLALVSLSRFRRIPFNVSWWAATFPWGVYAVSTMTIGEELPSVFFKVLGTGFAACVVLLWGVVFGCTVRKALVGEMFFSPCVQEAKREFERQNASTGESIGQSTGQDTRRSSEDRKTEETV